MIKLLSEDSGQSNSIDFVFWGFFLFDDDNDEDSEAPILIVIFKPSELESVSNLEEINSFIHDCILG